MTWRKASVPKKSTPMLMGTAVLADQNEIPDNHVLTVRDRVLSTDLQRIVQNNVKTDTVTLDLDGEWDDCASIYVTFNDETAQSGPWSLEWKGQPLTVPSAIGAVVGPVPVSVVGYGSDGELRLVTEAAPQLLNVVRSGYVEIVDDNEENKDILSQLAAAGAAAEDAAEAANAAATFATSAASSANSAASSANSAASSASSAATKANAAAVDAQNAYDTLQPYMATIDSCANILHREVGPDTVVTADDAFPCKPVEMTVYGNTTQNLWVNPSGTKNGVTVTANADGSITLSGSSIADITYVVVNSYILRPSTSYTLSIDKAFSENMRVGCRINNSFTGFSLTAGQTSMTFTTPATLTSVQMGVLTGATGVTIPGTYRVMLNEGSEAQPWCPPGLNSVGQLRDDEKNLWVNPSGTSNGITATSNADGSITLSGTSTAFANITTLKIFTLKPGRKYTFSVDKMPNLTGQALLKVGTLNDSSGIINEYSATVNGTTFTADSGAVSAICIFAAQSGTTVSGTYKVMLNEGSTAKSWVPPELESCVRVMTAGKNLNGVASSINDVSWANIAAGTDEYNIWSSKKRALLELFNSLPEGTYKLSGKCTVTEMYASGSTAEPSSSDLYGMIIRCSNNLDNPATDRKNTGSAVYQGAVLKIDQTITISPETSMGMYNDLYVYAPGRDGGFRSYADFADLQLELGSTATDYEPPNTTTTLIDLQGHTLNALPDGTRDELHIDGGGNVVLEKRVDVAIAPTDAGSWSWDSGFSRGRFALPATSRNEGTLDQDAELLCDKLPPATSQFDASYAVTVDKYGYAKNPAITSTTRAATVAGGATCIYPLAEPQTIDLGTITPPTMAAPNVTAYVADDTPAEMTLDYVRDVNIVHERLEERIAALELASATS